MSQNGLGQKTVKTGAFFFLALFATQRAANENEQKTTIRL